MPPIESLPPIVPPANRRHQAFADAWLGGANDAEAYITAGYHPKTKKTAHNSGSRIRTRSDVSAYIKAVQAKVARERAVLNHLEIRTFLARIVRTPLPRLNPENPTDENGDLIKSYHLSETEASCTRRIEKLDPLKAIEIDLKLTGDDPEAGAISQLAEALAALGTRNSLPTGTL